MRSPTPDSYRDSRWGGFSSPLGRGGLRIQKLICTLVRYKPIIPFLMYSNYTRIFIGRQIESKGVLAKLETVGMSAVVKDEAESARLAGFASAPSSSTEVHVHNDELAKA